MTDPRLRIVVDGLTFAEGPRWHDGRLWFSDFYTHHVLCCDADGSNLEMVCEVPGQPSGLGWLPDDRLLIVSMTDRRLLRLAPDRSLIEVADLSDLATWHCNDMVVDAHGNAFVGHFGFDLEAEPVEPVMASLARVSIDGEVGVAADEMAFPNGSVITPDGTTLIVAETVASKITAFDLAADGTLSNRRVWAEVPGTYPDGICLDAEGAVWFADALGAACIRVFEGGRVTERIEPGRGCFACMLGGSDRRTLYLMLAESAQSAVVTERHDAQIAAVEVDVPGTGLP
ncbi:MAG: SMP-30/gluconolactonase/LRE family protein [Acidimicrobiia bacterium]|nr:SMP-30/gluconolactonase/LRE family protein [Acidimicrobiia bacterium]